MRLPQVSLLVLVVALVGALPATAAARKSPLRGTAVSSRGYKGIKRVPRTGPAPAPPSISLGAGKAPDVLVDAAGTAHIVWNEEVPAGGSDVTHYCRIPRGATACDNPSGTPFPPISAPYSADFDGPKLPDPQSSQGDVVDPGPAEVKIHELQGSGAASPLAPACAFGKRLRTGATPLSYREDSSQCPASGRQFVVRRFPPGRFPTAPSPLGSARPSRVRP